MNTLAPRAANLVPRDEMPRLALMREAILASIAKRRPQVSDMYTGVISGKSTIAVILPVVTHELRIGQSAGTMRRASKGLLGT